MRKLQIPQAYKWPLAIALALHGLLFAALTLHVPTPMYKQRSAAAAPVKKIVNAHAISTQQVTRQVKRVQQIEQARLEKKRLAALRKKRAEQRRIAAIKRKKALAAKKRAEALARAKALAAAKAEAARKAKVLAAAKAEAARKAKAAAAAKAKRLAEAKAKRLAEAKAKRLAQAKALKQQQLALQQAMLQNQLQAEQQSMQQVQQRANAIVVDRYKSAILDAISQRWLVPAGVNKALKCQLLVNLGPGGVVLSVKTIKSSGNAALDRSATTAVYKSSPLPVPKDPAMFDKFRELRLTVRPESIVSG